METGGSGIRMKISSSSSLLSRRMSTTTNDNSSSAAGTGAGAASTGGGGLSSVGHMRRMSHPLFTSMDATEHRFTFYCLVCLEQHSDPFELDCHHIFCEPCLRIYRDIFLNDACTSVSNVTDSGSAGVDGFRARCPTCRRSADISDSSARVESPPGEKLSNGLAENVSAARRKISRTSLMDQNLKCDSCLAASGVNVLFQGGAAIVGGTVGGANGIDIAGADGYLMMNAQRNGLVPSYNLANGETATTPPATLDGHIKLSSDVAQSLGRGMSVMGAFSVEDADFHCSKCEMNLCKMCRARHDSQSVFRGHTVVNITSREAVQLYCYAHSMGGTGRRRACLFYCADCNRLECVICVLRDNPQHRAVKLRDAVAERRDSLKTLLNTLGPRLDRLEARVNQLKKMYNERRMNRVSAMSNPIPAPSHHDVAAADSELLQHRPFFSSGPFRHRQRRSLKEREKSATEQCRTASRTHSPSTAASGGGQRLNRERHQPLQRQQTLEVNHEDDDAVSVGTTDSDVASVAAEVEATSSNVSRRGSVASDESTAVEGETVTDDVAEVNSSLSSTSFAAVTEYIVRLKKLFNKSAKVIEINDPKKLMAIYDELSARLTTVVEFELPILQKDIDQRTSAEMTHHRQRHASDVPQIVIEYVTTVAGPTVSGTSVTSSTSQRSMASIGNPDGSSVTRPLLQQPSIEQSATGGGLLTKMLGKSISKSPSAEVLSSMSSPPLAMAAAAGRGDGSRSSRGSSALQGNVPMSLLVRPKLLWKIEKLRSDVGEMCNPSDVTFLPDESALVVAEYDSVNERNNRLQLFDRHTGRTIGALAQGQMQPLGVTSTRDGQHLVVTDCRGKRVRLLSLPTGQTVADIGKGQFGWPYGVALASHGQIVVSDAFNDTVSVFSPDGKRLKVFGGSGSNSSSGTSFRNPYHVAVDDRDVILVSDFGNNAVKAFDLTGRFIYCASESTQRWSSDLFGSVASHLPLMTGSSGGGSAAAAAGGKSSAVGKRRRLKGPRGIAIEFRQRHVIVADDRSRVCMFSSGGQYVRNLLTEDDSVKYPEAIDCSRSGLLAVTEWNQNNAFAIKLFNLYE